MAGAAGCAARPALRGTAAGLARRPAAAGARRPRQRRARSRARLRSPITGKREPLSAPAGIWPASPDRSAVAGFGDRVVENGDLRAPPPAPGRRGRPRGLHAQSPRRAAPARALASSYAPASAVAMLFGIERHRHMRDHLPALDLRRPARRALRDVESDHGEARRVRAPDGQERRTDPLRRGHPRARSPPRPAWSRSQLLDGVELPVVEPLREMRSDLRPELIVERDQIGVEFAFLGGRARFLARGRSKTSSVWRWRWSWRSSLRGVTAAEFRASRNCEAEAKRSSGFLASSRLMSG